MRNRVFWIGLIAVFGLVDLFGQGSAFGVKAGPLVGFQQWTSSRESELLLRYHAIAYIETYNQDAAYSLFAQTGYHVRGGALRLRGGTFQAINSQNLLRIPNRVYPYEFNNVSLAIGAKQRFLRDNLAFYYSVGVRGEYTLSTNLEDYHPENDPLALFNLIHPFPGTGVRRINYGVIVGGGIDFMFSELVGGMVELTINPDFSSQYKSPAFQYTDISTSNVRTIQERDIKNISIELSVGIRLLRIVEYVDQVF